MQVLRLSAPGLALVLCAALPAAAQTPHAAHRASPAASAPAAPSASDRYVSAFDGHRGHADAAPVPWRVANDTVGRIGGWRAYAREAAAAASAPVSGHGSAHGGGRTDQIGPGAHGRR
jgi:hypothetical protein